jgi:hypothetical protein
MTPPVMKMYLRRDRPELLSLPESKNEEDDVIEADDEKRVCEISGIPNFVAHILYC